MIYHARRADCPGRDHGHDIGPDPALRPLMAEDVIEQRVEDRGEPAVRTLAMPADTNPSGDIFGGWVLAQMDPRRRHRRRAAGAGPGRHRRARRHVVPQAGLCRRSGQLLRQGGADRSHVDDRAGRHLRPAPAHRRGGQGHRRPLHRGRDRRAGPSAPGAEPDLGGDRPEDACHLQHSALPERGRAFPVAAARSSPRAADATTRIPPRSV